MNYSWNQLYKQVSFNRVKPLFNDDFLLGVRQLLFAWINNNLPDINSSQSKKYDFMNGLMHELTTIHQNVNMPVKVIKYWIESIDVSQTMSSYDQLAQKIINNFLSERNIYANGNPLSYRIDDQIQQLRMLNMCNKKSIHRFEFQWQSYLSINNRQLSDNVRELNMEIVASIQNVIKLLTNVLGDVIQCRSDCLTPYQQNLSESCISRLAEIQVWFDEIAEIIWDTRSLINSIQKCDRTCCVAELKEIHDLFTNLINLIMVLENQPPEIITTDKNSPTTIRILLTLNKFIDVKKLKFGITVVSKIKTKKSIADAENSVRVGTSKFHVEENNIMRHLKDMKVLKVQRPENNRPDKIVAEKYILRYCLQFEIDNMKFSASAESWPVFVIVHQNQESLAKTALSWDKHFPHADRANPWASVPWENMSTFLKSIFYEETGCNLNIMHLNSLYEKCTKEILKNGEFVWSQSCHNFHGFKFNFWNWFYGAMRLTRECLRGPWKNGLIDGFLSETFVQQKLLNSPSGTFLLRFSDSEIGSLTPVYVEINEKNEAEIKKIVPFSFKEFEVRNRAHDDPEYHEIGNLIFNDNCAIKKCTHINGKSKYEAFKNHYRKLTKEKDGYEQRSDSDSPDVCPLVLPTTSSLSTMPLPLSTFSTSPLQPSILSPLSLPPSPLQPSILSPLPLQPSQILASVDPVDSNNQIYCPDFGFDDFNIPSLPNLTPEVIENVLNTPGPRPEQDYHHNENCAENASTTTYTDYNLGYSSFNSSIQTPIQDYLSFTIDNDHSMSNL